jgi:hypothetical protein
LAGLGEETSAGTKIGHSAIVAAVVVTAR